MLFSSLTFIFIFLPITLLIYYLSKDKYKNYILLLSSLLFYSWGEPKYIVIMILSIIFNYYFAILIDKAKSKNQKKLILIFSIIFNVGLLFIFKYLNFFTANISNLFSINLPVSNISLPIGISFYTFQILSYVVDVYNKNVKVQKNIFILATYISLFPQLIAGPIVRYQTVEKELKKRNHSIDKFVNGLKRFVIGMGKKIIFANYAALIADTIFNGTIENQYTGLILIIGTISYTIQIYFDFSGYSDMAIGLGRMFGFEFLENFNYPYVASSITDFWRRWHISLSTWFRDYVYIPLGGNRVNKIKWIRNILIVWCLTGFWHGAEWNFIIWGFYFAIILLLEKLVLEKILKRLPKLLSWFYAFILINIGWIIFRSENINLLTYIFKNIIIFDINGFIEFLANNYYMINYLPFLVIGFVFSFPIFSKINNKLKENIIYNVIKDICIVLIFVFSICILISNSYNPFIYFRF